MSLSTHTAAVLFRVEVMPETENHGEAYDARITEIQTLLDAAIKRFGLDALSDDSGRNVVHFRNEEDDVALRDSPTGQIVRMLTAQYFVLFRNASRQEVANQMANLSVRQTDATTYPGISWQFFDPDTFIAQAQPVSAQSQR